MVEFIVTHVSCRSVFVNCFVPALCVGGVCSMVLGVMDRSIGFAGAAFLSMAAALVVTFAACVFAAAFNVAAPVTGGLKIRISPVPEATDAGQPSGGPPSGPP